MSRDLVRCNILVPKEQRGLYKNYESSPKVCNASANTSNAALRVTQSTKPSPEVSSSSGKQETTKFQVKARETNPVTETSFVKYILCEQGHYTGQCEWSVLI